MATQHRHGKLALYAHECCECGNTIGYAHGTPPPADVMCNDCASSFVNVAYAMGMNTYDEKGNAVMPENITTRKWQNKEPWEYRTRMYINQWRVQNAADMAIIRRDKSAK